MAASSVPRSTGKLWSRSFFLLWQGQTISQLGNQAFAIAMLYWSLRATGSASIMGLLLAASALPAILLTPIGGAVADRVGRLRLILASDLVSGLGLLALALAMIATGSPRIVLPLLFLVSVLLGVARAFFNPAFLAAIPDLVEGERLAAANSVTQLAWQGAALLGQALGGVLYTLFGAPLLFLGDGLSFFFSAGCTALIRSPRAAGGGAPETGRERPAAAALAARSAAGRFRSEILEGLRFARGTRGLTPVLLGAAGFNFFLMPILVLLPIYVERTLRSGAEWYGFLLASVSVGSLAGFALSGLIRLSARRRGAMVAALMVLAPLAMIALGLSSTRPAALAVSFLCGAALAMINVQVISILQGATPPDLRGRVMSLLSTVSSGLAPLGMAVGGLAGDLAGKNAPRVYVLCGAAALLYELVLVPRRSVRAFLSTSPGQQVTNAIRPTEELPGYVEN
jgi:DHA3 family macrolide efflux protein-like MFS transporter